MRSRRTAQCAKGRGNIARETPFDGYLTASYLTASVGGPLTAIP
jgi:hypothetical protein